MSVTRNIGSRVMGGALFPLALALFLMAPTEGFAQTRKEMLKNIMERLDALERNMAQTSIRIGTIEENTRKMTGSIEEAKYTARQTQRKFQNFKGDIELRLKDQDEKLNTADEMEAKRKRELPADPDDLYKHSVQLLLNKKNYKDAAEGLSLFLNLYPDHPRAGDALYWRGELHYAQGEFQTAATSYLESYTSFPQSARAPDSLLKLGISLAELGQKEQSCLTLRSVNAVFPKAPQSVKSRARLEIEKAKCAA